MKQYSDREEKVASFSLLSYIRRTVKDRGTEDESWTKVKDEIIKFATDARRLHYCTCREAYLMILSRSRLIGDKSRVDWCLSGLSALETKAESTNLGLPSTPYRNPPFWLLVGQRDDAFAKLAFEVSSRILLYCQMVTLQECDRFGDCAQRLLERLCELIVSHQDRTFGGEESQRDNRCYYYPGYVEKVTRDADKFIGQGIDFTNRSPFNYRSLDDFGGSKN